MDLKRLSIDALLAAMCAVLGYLSLDFGNLKITFESLPVLIGALLFGAADGMAVGGVGTLIYQLLRYGVTLTTPLWILPYVLCGLWAGHYARTRDFRLNAGQLAYVTVISGVGIFLLNTAVLYLDSKIYGYYSFAFIFGTFLVRLLICIVKAVAFAALLPSLLNAARQALKGRR